MGALIYYCVGKIEALEEKLYQLKNQNENAEKRIDGEDRRRDGNVQREGMPRSYGLRHEPRKVGAYSGPEPHLVQVLACGEGRREVEQVEGPSGPSFI